MKIGDRILGKYTIIGFIKHLILAQHDKGWKETFFIKDIEMAHRTPKRKGYIAKLGKGRQIIRDDGVVYNSFKECAEQEKMHPDVLRNKIIAGLEINGHTYRYMEV